MFHYACQTQVHQIISADLVEVAVRQRGQLAGLGLAMKSSLAVPVPLHSLNISTGSTINLLLSL